MRVISPASSAGDGADAIGSAFHFRPAGVLRFALLLLVVANLGHIPALDLGARQAPLFLNDLCALAVLATGTAAMAHARSMRLNDVALFAILFASIGALSAVASVGRFGLTTFELIASLAYLARWVVYFGIYVVVINCVKERDVGPLWRALETTMVAFAAFGVFQSIFLPDFGLMVYPEAEIYSQIDPQGHRLVSTILEPNIAAAMIAIVLLVQISRLAFGAGVTGWKLWLLVVAFALTLSRSGAAGFIAGMTLILGVRGLGKRFLKFVGAALLLVILSLPVLLPFAQQYQKFNLAGGSGFAARIIGWGRALETFAQAPWFGVGFNTYGFVQERLGFPRVGAASYSVEGGLLFIAVMTGIVGLTLYSTMLWRVLRSCRGLWRMTYALPEERGLAVGTAAATVAILVHSVFVNSLLTPFVMFPLWVLWGLVFIVGSAARLRRPARDANPGLVVLTGEAPPPGERTALPAPSSDVAAAPHSRSTNQ